MSIQRKKLCAAAPLPSQGRGRGGVSNFLPANYIPTPPQPLPCEGRGAAAPSFAYTLDFLKWTHI